MLIKKQNNENRLYKLSFMSMDTEVSNYLDIYMEKKEAKLL